MKGFYISNCKFRNITDSRKLEQFSSEVSKHVGVETVNKCIAKKEPEIVLEASTSKEFKIEQQIYFTNTVGAEADSIYKQSKTQSTYNNKAFLIGEYTAFGASMVSAVLGGLLINNFATLATVCFASAIVLFLVAIILSHIALRKIRKLDLDHKLWPHKLITGFVLTCFCLALSFAVSLIAALATENVFIIIAAGVITFLLLMSKAFSKL